MDPKWLSHVVAVILKDACFKVKVQLIPWEISEMVHYQDFSSWKASRVTNYIQKSKINFLSNLHNGCNSSTISNIRKWF